MGMTLNIWNNSIDHTAVTNRPHTLLPNARVSCLAHAAGCGGFFTHAHVVNATESDMQVCRYVCRYVVCSSKLIDFSFDQFAPYSWATLDGGVLKSYCLAAEVGV